MKIHIAKDAGYCTGVRDAVSLAYEAADQYGTVYMLGDIVHNEKVVADLSNSGVQVVKDINDIPEGSHVLLRAHGTVPEIWERARKKNLNIIDATCPLVLEIHQEVKKLAKEERTIIVIGDHRHDEVYGIASQVKNPVIVNSPKEAMELGKIKKAGIVSQSTQMMENVQNIISILLTKVHDLRFVNTICYPTKRNQEQIKALADKCDVVIVIGSFTSANSKRLTQLSKEKNKNSYQVTGVEDINKEWFDSVEDIGISAGASTPDYVIEEVKLKIQQITKRKK
ncbi:MAG: 4-hydroxy-3-methylbut-2-enyl diphosphate reductase [Candidatus Marinimicrobia bacterium]|nr:4-hydroxy-3-methylbut-2-enyl diphosphate reductase [Candidatus Neomarinimicrobiota bacterium]MBL7022727.1 4-hydroxy-3-methylbut-2-enyl diphosphate reductase [Candidatus Neomarinimicrobiota bacterium]MBL7109144.1 4-hydroxy-3-methylbut-2-enyl diphosphate reductase [Candidatus Neomarinimicrobiota bacterium]